MFTIHWTIPQGDLLEEFLCMWESTKDGQIQVVVHGEKITIDLTLIAQQSRILVLKELWM
jgi:hypothetical protein